MHTEKLNVATNTQQGQVNAEIKAFLDPFNVIDLQKSTVKARGNDLVFTDYVPQPKQENEPILIETKEDYDEFNAAAIMVIITGKSSGMVS